MNNFTHIFSRNICMAAIAFVTLNTAQATELDVTVNTSSLSGTSGSLYFDLVSGGSGVFNSSTISSFSTDGLLGSTAPVGDAFGTLPGQVMLDTGSSTILNEMGQNITYGNLFSFHLSLTENGPGVDGTPDSFSLFVVDAAGDLVPTTEPAGSKALFIFNIDGTSTGNLNIYTLPDDSQPWQVTPVTAVPVPSAIWLLVTGLIGLGLNARRQVQG
jgi:hypothetical protein